MLQGEIGHAKRHASLVHILHCSFVAQTITSSGEGDWAWRTDWLSGRVSRSRLSFLSFSVLPILSWHAKSGLQSKYNFWIEIFSDLWSGWRLRDDCVGKEELHSLSWSGYLAFLLSQLLQLRNNKQLIRLQPQIKTAIEKGGEKILIGTLQDV